MTEFDASDWGCSAPNPVASPAPAAPPAPALVKEASAVKVEQAAAPARPAKDKPGKTWNKKPSGRLSERRR